MRLRAGGQKRQRREHRRGEVRQIRGDEPWKP